jgi:membrane-associated phospholipid phosphatase
MGGLFGYFLGTKLGRPLLMKLMKPATLKRLDAFYTRFGDWATAAGGLTPLPYKIFAISAGVFRTRLATFIPASVVARGIRFFGEAFLLALYGRKVLTFFETAFSPTNLLVMAVLAVILILIWRSGWIPKKVSSICRNMGRHWFILVNRIRERFCSAGLFSWHLLTGATLIVFAFIIFTKLASELLEHELTHFDSVIGQWFFALRAGLLTAIMRGITALGSPVTIIGLMIIITVLGLHFRKRLEIMTYNIAVIGAFGLSELLKRTFHRPRPPLPWLASATGFSFPSGHSLVSLTVYGFLAYLVYKNIKRPWLRNLLVVILLFLPIFIGISRIYLGVHFPSDVLAGWTMAAFWIGTCITGIELIRFRFATDEQSVTRICE